MTFALFAVLTAAPRWVSGNEEDDALLAALITTVALHDIAIIAGVSPTPLIQYGAETVELAANIRLKVLPRLAPGASRHCRRSSDAVAERELLGRWLRN